MNRHALALILLAAAALPGVANAALPDTIARSRAASLKPGQYLWDESAGGTGPVAIMVSIDRQHLYVWRGGALIGISTVSTGKPGKATPLGEFRILQKNIHHRSNIYSNAPMPYMQRLTWTGIAIHGGDLPGYPASHGCIRVPLAFAKLLFAATDMGGVVSVSDGQSGPFLRIEAEVASLATDAAPSWNAAARPAVQMAQAATVVPKPPLKDALPPRPIQPKPVRVAQAPARPVAVVPLPRLSMAPVALAQADLSAGAPRAAATPQVADPGQPHWRVPYYDDAAPVSRRDRPSE